MKKPGRIRCKLAALLSRETGLRVRPERCRATEGWERSSRSVFNDTFRWSATVERENGDLVCVLDSYDTMTACVTNGVTVDMAAGEVYAKEPGQVVQPSRAYSDLCSRGDALDGLRTP